MSASFEEAIFRSLKSFRFSIAESPRIQNRSTVRHLWHLSQITLLLSSSMSEMERGRSCWLVWLGREQWSEKQWFPE